MGCSLPCQHHPSAKQIPHGLFFRSFLKERGIDYSPDSGRLTTHNFIGDELTQKLNKYASVVKVKKLSETAKETACGTYITGERLYGGEYRGLVENMEIL